MNLSNENDCYNFRLKLNSHSSSPEFNKLESPSHAVSSSNDFAICIETNLNNENPSSRVNKLIDKLNLNLELNSKKKQLEIEEKQLQISILEDDKAYRCELNKHDLLQKSFELKKKSSELDYTNKLRDLLIDTINAGDFQKCSYLNLCLNNQSDISTSLFDINSGGKNGFPSLATNNYLNNIQGMRVNGFGTDSILNGASDAYTDHNGINQYNSNNDNFSDETSFVDDGSVCNNNTNNVNHVDSNENIENHVNQFLYPDENDMDSNMCENKQELSTQQLLQSTKNQQNPFGKQSSHFSSNKFSSSHVLGSRIIRHMICSSHKLEEYSNSAALKILFKGKCVDNDMCRRKEVHSHYLIDTTDCRRHISLYFQSSKYGLKFFKTYQIKSQGELEKIIRTFKMKLV